MNLDYVEPRVEIEEEGFVVQEKLERAIKHMNRFVSYLRIEMFALRQEYPPLMSKLVDHAQMQNWQFLPANFSLSSVSYTELVTLYRKAGYRPSGIRWSGTTQGTLLHLSCNF